VLVNRAYALGLLGICSFWIYRATRSAGPWRLAACALAPFLFASSWDFAEGAATELETPLYAAIGMLAVAGLPLDRQRLPGRLALWAGCVVLLPLARPEGLALAALLLVTYTVSRPSGERDWFVPLGAALVIASYYGWRIAEFGHWAPNTYYAKASTSRWFELRDGIAFLFGYASRTPLDAAKLLALLAAPALLAVPGWPAPAQRRRFGLVVACALVGVASVAVSGGDSYPEARRLLTLPMLLVLVLPFLLLGHRNARVRGAAVAALAIVALVSVATGVEKLGRAAAAARAGEPVLFRFPVECVADVAQTLVALAPEGRIAQSDFQLVKFFAGDHRVVDLHGLNDARIAHEPWSDRVTFGKFSQAGGIRENAEIYVYGNRLWSEEPMAQRALRDVLVDADLHWQFVGYGRGEDWPERERITPEQVEALVGAYRTASLRACGAFFNFLIRRDVAERSLAARTGVFGARGVGGVVIGPR
jgi:hypothetical protein